jgi:outer membrane autotransporter protein
VGYCKAIVAFLAFLALGVALPAVVQAADVDITTSTDQGVVLDIYAGTTVHILDGVTVDNNLHFTCPVPSPPGAMSVAGLCASTKAWTVTNDGIISPVTFGDGVHFTAGGSVTDSGTIDVGGNAIWIEGGAGSVDNLAGATINASTGGLIIGTFANATGGTVTNAGTISRSGQAIGIAGSGSVINYADALIQSHGESNAVAFVIGTSHVVINDGTIQSNDSGYGTGVATDYGDITNNSTGKILGAYNAIWANGSGATTVKNFGLIEASKAQSGGSAIEFDAGGSLTNSGIIRSLTSNSTTGDAGISFTGAGSITNRGTIESTDGGAAIRFNGGATHTLTLDTGSVLGGNVQGGMGTDNLVLKGTGSETVAKFLAFETIDMQGTDWTLSGAGTFTSSGAIDNGRLAVNGTLTTPTVSVLSGGILGGIGTVAGAVTVASGGKIAPGNSIGTLTVASALFSPNSLFEVEVDPSSADKLAVTGTATIDPTASVSVLAAPGTYTDGVEYLILDAGTRSGAFAAIVVDNSAFLDFTLDQSIANQVWLKVATVADFEDVAETPNQKAAASGLQELGSGNPLFDAIAALDADSARHAFDLSSGEIHPTIAGTLLDDSRSVREAILDRLATRFADDFVPGAAALGYAGAASDPARLVLADAPAVMGWGQGYGSWGRRASDGNAAAADRSAGGFVAGLDTTAGAWRFGGVFGYQGAGVVVADRASMASAGGYQFGGYGAVEQGRVALRFGGAVTLQTVDTQRNDMFAGVAETLTAEYGARTAQLFAEGAYRTAFGALTVEPFARLAVVDTAIDGFTESGGAAALSAGPEDHGITVATVGARFGATLPVASTVARMTGLIAWQHTFGETPTANLAFAGGTPFTFAGLPIAEDALQLQAGVALSLSRRATLEFAYSGQIASGSQDHGLTARLGLRF